MKRTQVFARMYIDNGLDRLEKFANNQRPELVNVGSGQFQVWIRKDREVCFRAMRAAQRD